MKEQNKEKLLRLIDDNAKLTNEQLAVMLGEDAQDVAQTIAGYEKQGVIRGYTALIDWDQTDRNLVSARIEIKVIPKGTMGFEEIAYTISQFREVETCYLMSGGYDFTVILDGKTLREVSRFVSEKLATLDSVLSTATHFVLKKYKEHGTILAEKPKDERMLVTP